MHFRGGENGESLRCACGCCGWAEALFARIERRVSSMTVPGIALMVFVAQDRSCDGMRSG
jgi:hypothetical protein